VQICPRNSTLVNTWFFSFFQRSFIYFHFFPLSTRVIKGTSYKIHWKNKEDNIKKPWNKRIFFSFFSSSRHHCRACRCGLLCSVIIVRCLLLFVTIRHKSINVVVCHNFVSFCLALSIHKCLFTNVHPLKFIPINALYCSNHMYYVHT
jgi:hypothetical protein